MSNSDLLGVILHPLVLLNISDYYTRAKLRNDNLLTGILMGDRQGRQSVVHSSFELPSDSSGTIDMAFCNRKIQLYQVTFPEQEPLGWFHVSSTPPGVSDLILNGEFASIRRQLTALYDLPIALVFDPSAFANSLSSLPLKAYEVVTDAQGAPAYIEITDIRLESGEAERIGVDDIVRDAKHTVSLSGREERQISQTLAPNVAKYSNTLSILYQRLDKLAAYVSALRKGSVPLDHSLLRQINDFVLQVERYRHAQSSTPGLSSALENQKLEVMLESVLASVTRGEQLIAELSSRRRHAVGTQ